MKNIEIVIGGLVYTTFVSIRVGFDYGIFAFVFFLLINYGKFCAVAVSVSALNISRLASYVLIALTLPAAIGLYILLTAIQSMTLDAYLKSIWFYELQKVVLFSVGGAISALLVVNLIIKNREMKK